MCRFDFLVFLSGEGILLATLVVLVQQRGFHVLGFAYEGTAGMVVAVMVGRPSLAALMLGRTFDRLTIRTIVVLPVLLILAGEGFAVLAFAPNLWATFLGVVLVGGLYKGIGVPMLALLGDVTRPQFYGKSVGIYQLFGDVGGSLGPIVGLESGLHFGMLPTYLAAGALLIVSTPVALRIFGRERKWRRMQS